MADVRCASVAVPPETSAARFVAADRIKFTGDCARRNIAREAAHCWRNDCLFADQTGQLIDDFMHLCPAPPAVRRTIIAFHPEPTPLQLQATKVSRVRFAIDRVRSVASMQALRRGPCGTATKRLRCISTKGGSIGFNIAYNISQADVCPAEWIGHSLPPNLKLAMRMSEPKLH